MGVLHGECYASPGLSFRWCLVLGLCGLLVGPIGLVVGVSCLLCSSALPGVWSFLRVTRRKLQTAMGVDRVEQVTCCSQADTHMHHLILCCTGETDNSRTLLRKTQTQPGKTQHAKTAVNQHPIYRNEVENVALRLGGMPSDPIFLSPLQN